MHSQETQVEALTHSVIVDTSLKLPCLFPHPSNGDGLGALPLLTSNQPELKLQMQACKALTVKVLFSSGGGWRWGVVPGVKPALLALLPPCSSQGRGCWHGL